MWLKSNQLHEGALKSDVRPGKNGTRKAEDGLNVCAEGENDRFGVSTSDLPGGLRPSWETTERTGGGSLGGVTTNQALPKTGHVAEGASSTVEDFWALLE